MAVDHGQFSFRELVTTLPEALMSDSSAWPDLMRLTESNGMPKSRTFLSKPCNAA